MMKARPPRRRSPARAAKAPGVTAGIAGVATVKVVGVPIDVRVMLGKATVVTEYVVPAIVTLSAVFERRAITEALRAHGGNLSRAAEAVGIHRSTLRRKLRELGLERRARQS
jgi:transcriptional regulator with GAF, ATPase, and Fis domain